MYNLRKKLNNRLCNPELLCNSAYATSRDEKNNQLSCDDDKKILIFSNLYIIEEEKSYICIIQGKQPSNRLYNPELLYNTGYVIYKL